MAAEEVVIDGAIVTKIDCNYYEPVISRKEMMRLIAEDECDISTLEKKALKAGTKIVVFEFPDDGNLTNPEYAVELTKDAVALCSSFGEGLSSDEYFFIDTGGEQVIIICDEPFQFEENDEYNYNLKLIVNEKYDIILVHV